MRFYKLLVRLLKRNLLRISLSTTETAPSNLEGSWEKLLEVIYLSQEVPRQIQFQLLLQLVSPRERPRLTALGWQ